VQALWFLTSKLTFERFWFPPYFRPHLLKIFGGKVGRRVLIRHDVRIMWPWKFSAGDDCWIGEGARIINLETVSLGDDVCLSQEVMVCTGSHDYRKSSFDYRNAAIKIGDGVWVAARATLLPGVTVGECSVVAAGEIVRHDIPNFKILLAGILRDIEKPA